MNHGNWMLHTYKFVYYVDKKVKYIYEPLGKE